jgi:predicted TIM-barrel fold metal-dependent hydrolase
VRDGFRIFDTHTHIGTARHSGRVQTADQLLGAMDQFGIDRAVAIPFPVVEDHRAQHDEIGRAVRAHPGRFVGAACIPPFVAESDFRDEVRRCVEQWGFRAIKLQPQYQALNPVSDRSDFLFDCAARLGMAVIVHTGTGVPFSLPSLYILKARKFPGLPIILGHAGGSVYMHECIVAAAVCSNIYVEVSSLMPHHIAELAAHVPSNRLMAGSDIIESIGAELGKVVSMDVAPEWRRDVLWNTAAAVFGT